MADDIRRLSPSAYHRQPWKNGGGVTTTIAQESSSAAGSGDWSDIIWQLGRTQIAARGPFSDLTGFERLQVVVAGSGLVLTTSSAEIDVRTPFKPVRYDGGTPIVSKLENGPVEVVNLIARRARCSIELVVIRAGEAATVPVAEHILYAPLDDAQIVLNDVSIDIPHDHALRFKRKATVTCTAGVLLLCSITDIQARL